MGFEDIGFSLMTKFFEQEKLKKTPDVFIFEFEKLMNQYDDTYNLEEDQVLKLDSSIEIFCTKYDGYEVVNDLYSKYNELKQELKEEQKKDIDSCKKRTKEKLKRLDGNNLYDKDRLEKQIESLKEKLNDPYACGNHGIEKKFRQLVIEPMNEYISERRRNRF